MAKILVNSKNLITNHSDGLIKSAGDSYPITGKLVHGDSKFFEKNGSVGLTVSGGNLDYGANLVLNYDSFKLSAIDHNGSLGAQRGPALECTSKGELKWNNCPLYSTPFTKTSPGLVPAPGSADVGKFLGTDGLWVDCNAPMSLPQLVLIRNNTLGTSLIRKNLFLTSYYIGTDSYGYKCYLVKYVAECDGGKIPTSQTSFGELECWNHDNIQFPEINLRGVVVKDKWPDDDPEQYVSINIKKSYNRGYKGDVSINSDYAGLANGYYSLLDAFGYVKVSGI